MNEPHKTLYEYESVAIIRFASNGKIVSVNRQACETFGYGDEEFRELSIHDIDPGIPAGAWPRYVEEVAAGSACKFIRRFRRKDGTVFPARVIFHRPGPGDDGSIVGIIHDISKEIRTEQALRESEDLLRKSQEAARLGSYILDLASGLWRCTPVLDKIFGIGDGFSKDVEGWASLVAADQRGKVSAEHERCVKRESDRFGMEYRVIRPSDGAERWVHDVSELECDEGGKPVRMIGVIRDITDRKRIEEDFLRAQFVLDHSREQIFLGRPDGSILYANDAACRSLGYEREELLRMTVFDVNVTTTPQRFPVDKAAALGKDFYESTHKARDGRLFPVEISITVFHIGEEEVHGIFVRDISERKKAEDALRESELFLRQSQKVARLGTFKLDLASMTWVGSDMLRELWGIPEGYPNTFGAFLDLIVPEQREEMRRYLERHIVEGRNRGDVEIRIHRRNDGQERWLHCIGELECDGQGIPVCMVGTAQDITESKRGEAEREALQERLRESHKMETVGRLAGGVAHEFNNMLSIILGYAELMRGRLPEGDPMRKFVGEIERAGERARDITGQLLAFSRRQLTVPKIVNLNDQLVVMIKTLGRLLGETVRIDFTPAEELWNIRIDPAQLDQILLNLGVNARDAMPSGGRVTAATANVTVGKRLERDRFAIPSGDYVLLTVADEGTGMDRETLSHIFEPFYSTKGLGKGTGLGLPTVYGIVKQNGGYIEVDSEPGKGTVFRVYFPRAKNEIAPEPVDRPVEPDAPQGRESILLVEDEEMVRGIVSRQLEELGYKVFRAGSPHDALELFGKPGFSVDLLVTDVMMPGMSGGELWEKVRSLRPKTRVLFVSGYAAADIADRGILEGKDRVLTKPFTQSGLVRAVREVLSRR